MTKLQRPTSSNVAQLDGWILIAPTVNQDGKRDGGWYICSDHVYGTKTIAERLARNGNWSRARPRVIRGKITASQDQL